MPPCYKEYLLSIINYCKHQLRRDIELKFFRALQCDGITENIIVIQFLSELFCNFSLFIIVTAGLDILLDRADADMPAKKLPKEVVDLIEYNAAQAGCQRSCTIGLSGIKVTVPSQRRYVIIFIAAVLVYL